MPVYDKYNFLLLPKMLVLNPKDGEPYGKNGENVFYKECMRKSCREDRIFLYIKGMSHISVTQGGKSL